MMDGGETGQGVAAGKIPLPGLFAEGPICSHQEGWWGVCCRSEERCWRLAPGTLGKSDQICHLEEMVSLVGDGICLGQMQLWQSIVNISHGFR